MAALIGKTSERLMSHPLSIVFLPNGGCTPILFSVFIRLKEEKKTISVFTFIVLLGNNLNYFGLLTHEMEFEFDLVKVATLFSSGSWSHLLVAYRLSSGAHP